MLNCLATQRETIIHWIDYLWWWISPVIYEKNVFRRHLFEALKIMINLLTRFLSVIHSLISEEILFDQNGEFIIVEALPTPYGFIVSSTFMPQAFILYSCVSYGMLIDMNLNKKMICLVW